MITVELDSVGLQSLDVLQWLTENVGGVTVDCSRDIPRSEHWKIGRGWRFGWIHYRGDTEFPTVWDIEFDDERAATMFILRWL